MKRRIVIFLIAITPFGLLAQDTIRPIKIGLFASLYLDNAFDSLGNYSLKNTFPRQSVAGLEFYEGAVMAIDSLNKDSILTTLEVFDIQSDSGKPTTLLEKGKFDSLDLIIGQVNGPEFIQLARIAKEKNIPFISATYPNDGGIRSSPMVYIANPRISSHIEFINGQLQKKWPQANLLWVRGDSQSDDFLESTFKNINETTGILKNYRPIVLNRPVVLGDISKWIDTTKTNVIIVGSLDDDFATEFAKAIVTYQKKGVIQLVGMPNWERLKEIQLMQYAPLPIFYTTSFFVPASHNWGKKFEEYFKKYTVVKPSSSAYKGFELTYYFTNIISKYKSIPEMNEPDDMRFKVLNDLDFKPVSAERNSGTTDYFENKKIYLVRKLNSVTSSQ